MRRFYLHLALFSFISLGLLIAVCQIRIPNSYVIYKTKGTSYEKIAWNLWTIEHESSRLNGAIVFLGPSLIQAGISDSVLNKLGLQTVNMGTNGGGNEVELYFLERIIPFRPAKVFFHVYKGQQKGLHSMTPLLYDPVDLLKKGQEVNFDFLRYLFKRFGHVVNYLLTAATNDFGSFRGGSYGERLTSESINDQDYGKLNSADLNLFFEGFNLPDQGFRFKNETQTAGLVFTFKILRRKVLYFLNNLAFISNERSQQKFEEATQLFCEKAGIDCEPLYMPVIADVKATKDFDSTFYAFSGRGKVNSIRNFTPLDSACFWSDLTHLSRRGAVVFSEQLYRQKVVNAD